MITLTLDWEDYLEVSTLRRRTTLYWHVTMSFAIPARGETVRMEKSGKSIYT